MEITLKSPIFEDILKISTIQIIKKTIYARERINSPFKLYIKKLKITDVDDVIHKKTSAINNNICFSCS